MSGVAYAAAEIKVRDDITKAHQRAWQRLAEPGTWWTGAERVAIAAEVRNAVKCALCRERKSALSPHAVEGTHDSLGVLPEQAVDVIHRVVTDPGRLSKAWYEKVLAGGLEDTHYVEIIGVVITVVTVDVFCRGVGVPLHQQGPDGTHRREGARAERVLLLNHGPRSRATGGAR